MAHEFRLPDIGEGLTEGEIVRWLVDVGDEVKADQPLVEVETDKAVVEIPAPASGILLHRGGAEGDVIRVGEILAVIGAADETWEPDAPIVGTLPEEAEVLTSANETAPADPTAAVQALPVVRKLAREMGVDLATVPGTGPGGRITREDVERASTAATDAPEERVRLSKLRRTISEHLSKSWTEIPHVTTFDDIDGRPLLEARRALADAHGDFPIEALVIKAVLPVLVEFAEFNASLDGEDLILKRHYDIGIAVDTPAGLIVPVASRADELAIEQLAQEVSRLVEAAIARSLVPDEVRGATFTVSNIGAVGGGHGTPIVPYGTTAILSFGRAQDKPVVEDGEVRIAPMVPLSLSYDHRVIDGALGRRFIGKLSENLEDPSTFL
ncbi:MAG: dihydrolipoamide acetyltransferase family protein [Acidimicrobiia bacterium]